MTSNCPDSLYAQCLQTYMEHLNYNVSTMDRMDKQLQNLPTGILMDVYVMMSQCDSLMDMLLDQLSNLETFERLLRFDQARQKLFRCLSVLMSNNKALAAQLQFEFTMRYKLPKHESNASKANTKKDAATRGKSPYRSETNETRKLTSAQELEAVKSRDHIEENDFTIGLAGECAGVDAVSKEILHFGMRLGSFLNEAGWLSESTTILQCVAAHLRRMNSPTNYMKMIRLDCLQRLLNAESSLCNFKCASRTYNEIQNELLPNMDIESIPKSLLANTYVQFSGMYFARSEYHDSHMWSVKAIRQLDESTPERIVVDVLRQASKSCVVKRDFQRANMLICQATKRARSVFGERHQKYADTLLDHGFFLLNVDSVHQSLDVYKNALEIKEAMFGKRNFHVAIAHEDLSYAYYVHEYSTGNFTYARDHVDKAVDIMKDLVPNDHHILASARRVKALLLEEIALDKMADGVFEDALLSESEELHKFALQLSLEVFGESNVQTAKHYGNLGRLYQTMNRFDEAECMHQKAIKIKTLLLGPWDYEVGLSIGHLASLYNFQMRKYREAEELYLRSIDISIRLFGHSYSGLEYDYLGLCHVYETLREFEKYLKYATILENWQMLRVQNNGQNKIYYPSANDDYTLDDIKHQFFSMSVNKANN